ncbi:MAG: hypothetical protein SFU86_13820 [Pirellulaceae bacterium]|nr:hypothetical protein [Pirellulaceae bacterium]
MSRSSLSRRSLLQGGLAALALPGAGYAALVDAPGNRAATFEADITPPLGHPLIGGLRRPAVKIADRLLARGVALLGADKPLVVAALDWCELRNDAYDQFREALAKAAETTRERVLLSCNHQHDAPYCDLTAQKLLAGAGLAGVMFDPAFFQQAMEASAAAVAKSLATARPITHVGVGKAQVERVACNRRVVGADGKPRFNRYSFVRDPAVRDAPDGEIDPWLQTLSLFDGDDRIVALSYYATHPMSYYGNGEVSYDFPGIARQMRQRETPGTMQIYLTGCSGDVVAAKYNDGTPAGRQALAEQLLLGMRGAGEATKRTPLTRVEFRHARMHLPPPDEGPLSAANLTKTLHDPKADKAARIYAAMGLSYRERCAANQAIDVPAIDFGPAQLLVLPAELFVGYQLAAQKMRPDQAILTAGFGECAPGYTPTDQARREGFVEEHGYCWVRPDVEATILAAIREALGAN